MKTNLLISTGTFYPDIGGPPTYLKQLSEALTQQNISLEVLTFGDTTPEQIKKISYPVKYITRFAPVWWRLSRYSFNLFFKVLTSKNWFVNDYGLPAYLVSKLTGKKYTIKIVGDFAWEWSTRHLHYKGSIDAFQLHRPHVLSRLVHALQKTYVQHARQIIVPSDYLKRILMGWSIDGTKIHVIHNAPQIPVADTHQTIQLEQIAASEVVLCTVARLVPWKGIDHVLEALGKFSHLQFRYLIVGTGPDKERLEKLSTDLKLQHKIVFMGAKTAAEVSAILNRTKLFVLLSKYEGLPHVILEALAHRIPCLTSNAGGFPEVLNDQNGLMLGLDSPDFKATLQQTLEQFILGRHALTQCKPVLEEKFRFETMVVKTKSMVMG